MIGCHPQTLYLWISRGLVKSSRIGRKVLIDREKLLAQLDGQDQANPPTGSRTGPKTMRAAGGIGGGRRP
jgi:hypothetical protein